MDVLLLLSLLSSISILILFIVIHGHRTESARRRASLPPGPATLPLIGNLHQLDTSSPHHSLWQLSKRHGPLMSLRFGSVPTLVVSSAKMAKEVLKTHDLKFASRPRFLGMRKLSYSGLDLAFAPYGPYWREMKKLCVLHLFSSQRVHSFRPIRENEVAHLIHKLSSKYEDKVVNLTEKLMSFNNSLICSIALGKKYGRDYEEGVELGRNGKKGSRLQVLLNEAQALLTEFYFSDHFPLMGWVDRLRGTLWRLDKTFKELDMLYQRVIDDHMDAATARPKTSDQQVGVADIIDIFLQMMNNQSFSFDLTFDHIKAMLMNIFIAGTDTGSAIMIWAMTALLSNPRVMNKVQGEIRGLFGGKDFINEDDIERLPYLKAVVKETLRLFPPSPLLLPRETMERCEIDGYEIEARTLVHVNAWAIARDPQGWEEPEEFYPERFLDGASSSSSVEFKATEFGMIPFGSGRRMCPAMHLGVVTVELSLANLLHSFDWELPRGVDKLDMQVKPGITMHKKADLQLVAKKPTRHGIK